MHGEFIPMSAKDMTERQGIRTLCGVDGPGVWLKEQAHLIDCEPCLEVLRERLSEKKLSELRERGCKV